MHKHGLHLQDPDRSLQMCPKCPTLVDVSRPKSEQEIPALSMNVVEGSIVLSWARQDGNV